MSVMPNRGKTLAVSARVWRQRIRYDTRDDNFLASPAPAPVLPYRTSFW